MYFMKNILWNLQEIILNDIENSKERKKSRIVQPEG